MIRRIAGTLLVLMFIGFDLVATVVVAHQILSWRIP